MFSLLACIQKNVALIVFMASVRMKIPANVILAGKENDVHKPFAFYLVDA